MRQGGRASLTQLEHGDRIAMPSTLITVAIPAQATRTFSFALQLRGPFGDDVRTGLSPYPRSLGRLIVAYSSSSKPFVYDFVVPVYEEMMPESSPSFLAVI